MARYEFAILRWTSTVRRDPSGHHPEQFNEYGDHWVYSLVLSGPDGERREFDESRRYLPALNELGAEGWDFANHNSGGFEGRSGGWTEILLRRTLT